MDWRTVVWDAFACIGIGTVLYAIIRWAATPLMAYLMAFFFGIA